jgi:hypothetical protein
MKRAVRRTFVNKTFFILATVLLAAAAARADLEIVQMASDTNAPFPATMRLRGDKLRLDQQQNTNGGFVVIIDLNTRDSFTLLPREKKFLKRSGAEILKNLALDKKLFGGGTNELYLPPALAQATGRIEPVGDYAAEIYSWSGAGGTTQTLWVAKNFPDYEKIRAELVKLDRFNETGPHPGAQPELSPLPGMVVQSELPVGDRKIKVRLVSAKTAPLDAELFAVPADYSPWVPPRQNSAK